MQLNNLSKGLANHLTIPAGCGFCALSWAGNFQESKKVRLLLLSSWQIKKPEHPTQGLTVNTQTEAVLQSAGCTPIILGGTWEAEAGGL